MDRPDERLAVSYGRAREAREDAAALRGESQQSRRFKPPADDTEQREQLLQVVGRTEGEERLICEVARRFCRRVQRLLYAAGIGVRPNHPKRRRPDRRQRKAAHSIDDPIEFEGPEGAGVHSRV